MWTYQGLTAAAAEQTKKKAVNEFDYVNHPVLMMLNPTPGMYTSSNADINEFIRNDKRFNLIHNLSDRGGDVAAFGNLYCTIITAKRPVSALVFGASITLKSTGVHYKLGKNFRKSWGRTLFSVLKQINLTELISIFDFGTTKFEDIDIVIPMEKDKTNMKNRVMRYIEEHRCCSKWNLPHHSRF